MDSFTDLITVMEESHWKLSMNAQYLYYKLAYSAYKGNSTIITTSFQELTQLTSLSRNTLKKAREELIQSGLLELNRDGNGRGNSTGYRLTGVAEMKPVTVVPKEEPKPEPVAVLEVKAKVKPVEATETLFNEEKPKRKTKKQRREEIESKAPPKPVDNSEVRRYGAGDNVILSDIQIEKLRRKYGESVVYEYIGRLDGWIANGHWHDNHYVTIVNWINKAIKKGELRITNHELPASLFAEQTNGKPDWDSVEKEIRQSFTKTFIDSEGRVTSVPQWSNEAIKDIVDKVGYKVLKKMDDKQLSFKLYEMKQTYEGSV